MTLLSLTATSYVAIANDNYGSDIYANHSSASAEQKNVKNKRFSVGLASTASGIIYDDYGSSSESDSDMYTGFGVYGSVALTNWAALRGLYSSQTHEDYSSAKFDRLEVTAQFGRNLLREGFKAYGNVGYFNESHKNYESFNGIIFGGGLGYNWRHLSVDGWLNFHALEDYIESGSGYYYYTDDALVVSAGMGVAYRF